MASPEGRLDAHSSLPPLGRTGWEIAPGDHLIPAPAGTTLVHLPGRFAIGGRPGSPVSLRAEGRLAVAAVLPPGYLRTLLPVYDQDADAPVLPLYGYAAVGVVDGEARVAAIQTDAWDAWDPQAPERQTLPRRLGAARRALPGNRLVPHLTICATEYRCLTAQNLFLQRGEGAIPVSPACNAACLGCISEQWGDVASPQTRMGFAPSATEIAELAAWHLQAGPENFVSFGQGCEGEPLTRGAVLVEATRRIRAAAPDATIHINTNASRPEVLHRLIAAGLNSIRISIFSLDEARFRAYYRPVGYGLAEVRECARLMRAAGGQVTINLLTFPGITDAPAEVSALVDFIGAFEVDQVQLRTLNVDPIWLLDRMAEKTRGIGMRRFVEELRRRCPRLQLGNFTRPWPVRSPLSASPSRPD